MNNGLIFILCIYGFVSTIRAAADDIVFTPVVSLENAYQMKNPSPVKDNFGKTLSSAGDFNDDGIDDFLVSQNIQSTSGNVYLFFGSGLHPHFSPDSPSFDPTLFSASDGILFATNVTTTTLGLPLDGGLDFNGDSISDIVLVESSLSVNRIYLVFGTSGTFPFPFNIRDLNSSSGIIFETSSSYRMATTGFTSSFYPFPPILLLDINNDSLADLIFPVWNSTSPVSADVLVIYGNSSVPSIFDITNISATDGFIITFDDQYELSLSGAGDVNQDGFNDFLIGNPDADLAKGHVYLFNGGPTIPTSISSSTINGTYGVVFQGSEVNFQLGRKVFGGENCDINNDGFPDFFVLRRNQPPIHPFVFYESLFVVYGGSSFPTTYLDNSLSAASGFQIKAQWPSEWINELGVTFVHLGHSIVCSDINYDGINDILMGSPRLYGAKDHMHMPNSGVYIIYGRTDFPGVFDLEVEFGKPETGFFLSGLDGTHSAGYKLAMLGDINNDTLIDFAISDIAEAPQNFLSDDLSGIVYLLYGNQSAGKYFDPSVGTSGEYFSCEPGTYNIFSGISVCNACPQDSYQKNSENSVCLSCAPKGCACPPGTILPDPLPGWQILPGQDNAFVQCKPPGACPGGRKCAPGYKNVDFLCEECEQGYYRYNSDCSPCLSFSSSLLPLFVIVYLFFLAVLIPVSFRGHKYGILSMYASLFQILSLFSYIKISAPSIWTSTFSTLSVSLLSVETLAPGCIVVSSSASPTSPITTNLWQIFSPLITLGVYTLYYFVSRKIRDKMQNSTVPAEESGSISSKTSLKTIFLEASDSQLQTYIGSAFVFSLSLLYPIVTKSALQLVDCIALSPTYSVLEFYSGMECNTAEWYPLAVLGYLTLIFFSFGVPFYLLYASRSPKTLTYRTRFLLACFMDKYQPQYAYWEAFGLIRKTLILVFTILFTSYISFSIFALLLLFGVSMALHIQHHPYWTIWLNYFETLTLFLCFCIIVLASLIQGYSVDPATGDLPALIISVLNILLILIAIPISIYITRKHRTIFKAFMKDKEVGKRSEDLIEESITDMAMETLENISHSEI